jgi:hypothetical protein
MTTEINVLSRTQIIKVEPVTKSVSLINAGPPGPGGAIGSATGSVILIGTSPPTAGDGAVGNYWIDKVHHILYGPKAASGTIWPIALYGAQPPPLLLGENRQTSAPSYTATLLPVSVALASELNVDMRCDLSLQINVQPGARYALECRVDGVVYDRFAYPLDEGTTQVSASVILRDIDNPTTVSVQPNRISGSGNCTFSAGATKPAYLTVYREPV